MWGKRLGMLISIVALTAVLALAGCGGSQPAAQDNYIGDDAAKTVALEHIGIAEASTSEMEIALDTAKDPARYVISFKAGGLEYDYEIDAATGDILAFESEIDKLPDLRKRTSE